MGKIIFEKRWITFQEFEEEFSSILFFGHWLLTIISANESLSAKINSQEEN